MMDFASTPARAKGVAPTISCEESRIESATSRPSKASPLPTTNGVDKMYHQLVEIHAIAAVQLVECDTGIGLTRPLMWLTPTLVGEDPL
jgi:hypothetical protein